ncbi:hypothetical protein [Frigidibacter sp. SD6-1]|uniref:hypothetical protein n=1 Tax=Frigidibacter sp. SD6-1 TaxID=3032581 RepID=UPI0024DF5C92|nr:hypothetical protein [Frigidibacter sp. SD6-1]
MTAHANSAGAETLSDVGKAGFETCLQAFPDSKAAHTTMKDSGWRFELSSGRFRLYSKNGRRVLAGTTTSSNDHSGCMIAVSKLSGAQAVNLAKEIVSRIPGAKPVQPTDGDALAEWVATVNGVKVHIGAMDVGDFHFMRGAGVLMQSQ